MWSEKFLNAIDAGKIGRALDRRVELVKNTDPRNIHIENISHFFGIPFRTAKFFCDVAVREGVFNKRIGYLCPKDKNVIISLLPGEPRPEYCVCFICQVQGEDDCEFNPADLETIEIYSLASLSEEPEALPA